MIKKLSSLLAKFAGPNSAHVIDALVAFELSAAAAALESQSARDYAVHHPSVAVIFTIAPPILTALVAKFRKAASQPQPPAPPAKGN